jgi:hypothetical protein
MENLNGKERKTDKEIKGEFRKKYFVTCFASLPDLKMTRGGRKMPF